VGKGMEMEMRNMRKDDEDVGMGDLRGDGNMGMDNMGKGNGEWDGDRGGTWGWDGGGAYSKEEIRARRGK
jgi:hypothetical protein